ncbi:MAG: ABC transporter transmembrane domain-containing protein [Cyclobacteriaceae bacterium]
MSTSLLTEFWRTRRIYLLVILGLGWLGSVCTFMVPVSLGAFFDIHFQAITNRTKLLKLFGVQLETMEAFFFFFAGVIVLKAIFTYAEKYWITWEAEQFIHQITRRLFAAQINWSPETFQHKPYGRYLLRYSGDMNSVKNLLIRGLHGGIKDLLFLLSGFGILFLLNTTLSTILLISLVLYIPLMIWLDRYQNPLIKEKRNRKSFMLSYVASQFAQHEEIKALAEEKEVIRKFRRNTHKLLVADRAYHVSENVRQIFAPLMGHVLTGILLWQVVVRPELQISGGALLVYLLVLASVISPLRRLFKVPGVLRRGMLSLNKIELFLQKESHIAPQKVATKTITRELVA